MKEIITKETQKNSQKTPMRHPMVYVKLKMIELRSLYLSKMKVY